MSRNKRRRMRQADASASVTDHTIGDALTGGSDPQARHGTADTGRPPRWGTLPTWLQVLDALVRVIDVVLRLL
ncbi:hypothetical protein GCM10022403_019680 [Streptomyces coacervatus]|uniref:Uncharacterized protein n=1 Tax=Streptomyces coacervatus TaxID=647381 RepID=A0ABP7H8V7_9ACTN|nr:hypothetical protein [Streptomyces coacervatus]MDF2267445.1 hypothetical protein [Streptomyces coacervatus]